MRALSQEKKTRCFFVLSIISNCIFIKVFVIMREKLASSLYMSTYMLPYGEEIGFCFNLGKKSCFIMQCRVISCRHTARLKSSTIVLCNVPIYAMVINWATIRFVHNTIKIYFHMHVSVNESATKFGCKPFVKILVLFEPLILVSQNTVSLPPYEFSSNDTKPSLKTIASCIFKGCC